MQQIVEERIPVGRMGARRDIALACIYLASPAAGFLTGHTLVVDGGEWMWR
jgi:NAD(P)-dependent dehydrogenase (short-subunit alcohol dehydrogenase family)